MVPTGTWTMTVADGEPMFDDGVWLSWCLNLVSGGGGDGGGDGGGVPATSTWGLIAIIALVMGGSVFFLGRKARTNA